MTFLGCEQRLVERDAENTHGTKKVKGVEWDVSHSMKRCVAKYETAVHAIIGRHPRIVPADTPFVPSETKHSRCRATNKDEYIVECPTCCDTFQRAG